MQRIPSSQPVYVALAIHGKTVGVEGTKYIALYALLTKMLELLENEVLASESTELVEGSLANDSVEVLLGCLRAAQDIACVLQTTDCGDEEALRLSLLRFQNQVVGYRADFHGCSVRSLFLTVLIEVETAANATLSLVAAQKAPPQSAGELGRIQFNLLYAFAISFLHGIEKRVVEELRQLDGSLPASAVDAVLACTDTALGMMWELNEYGVWDQRSRRPVEALMEAHLLTERLGAGGELAEDVMREAFLDFHRAEI